jgi:hypothetical protein
MGLEEFLRFLEANQASLTFDRDPHGISGTRMRIRFRNQDGQFSTGERIIQQSDLEYATFEVLTIHVEKMLKSFAELGCGEANPCRRLPFSSPDPQDGRKRGQSS